MSLKFHEMTIDAYLSALGSTAPAPGGGAAAALHGSARGGGERTVHLHRHALRGDDGHAE